MRLVQTLSALAFAARVAFAVPVEAGEAAEITDDDLTAVSFAPGECKCPPPNNDLVTTTGTPEGTMKTYKGLGLYVTKPKRKCKREGIAVLYLTDVFGLELQNKLLADAFAKAGYLTIAPDFFAGNPLTPANLTDPSFNITAYIASHNIAYTDPIVANAIEYIQVKLGIPKIAITGYCYGGRYVFRFLAAGKGGDLGFAAHPSLLEDSEVSSITKPLSLAYAETDMGITQARRNQIDNLLQANTIPWETALHSGTTHGYAVRGAPTDLEQYYGKVSAFVQSARWFNYWA